MKMTDRNYTAYYSREFGLQEISGVACRLNRLIPNRLTEPMDASLQCTAIC